MDHTLRYATDADFAAVAELDGASFGFRYSAQELEDALLDVDPAGLFLAVDTERTVGVSGEMPFTTTLPGGAIAAVGLSWESVEVTRRRRGVLREMVEQQLRGCCDRGESVAILTASRGRARGACRAVAGAPRLGCPRDRRELPRACAPRPVNSTLGTR